MTEATDPVNVNIASHKGLGDQEIFQTEVTGDRRAFVNGVVDHFYDGTRATVEIKSALGLMDYDSSREGAEKDSMQGTYLLTVSTKPGRTRKLILRIKHTLDNYHTNCADGVFNQVGKHENGQDKKHLSLTATVPSPYHDEDTIEHEGYVIHFTTYQEGRHIMATPTLREIQIIARGMAALRNALDQLAPSTVKQIKRSSADSNQTVASGLKFIQDTPERALALATKFHAVADAKTIIALATQFAETNAQNGAVRHGWPNEGNMLITPDNRLHLVDNESVVIGPPGLDEGIALYRGILDKIPANPAYDHWAINKFAVAYNSVAGKPMSEKALADSTALGAAKSVLYAYHRCHDKETLEWGKKTLERHGEFLLDAVKRTEAALKAEPTPPAP